MRLRKQESSISVLTEGQQETGSLISKNARKSNQNNSESRQRELKIYVAGLPYKATRDDIFFYFQEFGEIVSLDITYIPGVESYSPNGEKDLNYRNPSRYCILEVKDETTFEAILSYSPHRLFGRNLYCTEYKQGSKLMKEIRLKNQRRVLLKGVPLQYKMGHIKQIIQDTVGEIEAIYDFRDDIKPTEPHFEERLSKIGHHPANPAITVDGNLLQGHEYRNYTVLFFSKAHAMQLLTIGRLMVDRNVYAIVEPFKPRVTPQDTKSERRSKMGSQKSKDPFEAQFDLQGNEDNELAMQMAEVGSSVSFVNNDNQSPQSGETSSFGKVYLQQNRGISNTTSNLPAYSKFCKGSSKKTNWSLFEIPSWKKQGLVLHEIPEIEPVEGVEPALEILSTKPTSKQYFSVRSTKYEINMGNERSKEPEAGRDGANIRFNICRNPWALGPGHRVL